jgi:hypothetical protein
MGLFFKPPKIRQFNHQPIYWDPAKDRQKERLERARQELGMTAEGESYQPQIRRGSFREQRTTLPRQRQKGSIFRVILILLVIIILIYYFL